MLQMFSNIVKMAIGMTQPTLTFQCNNLHDFTVYSLNGEIAYFIWLDN